MVLLPLLLILAGDFPICNATHNQYYPSIYFYNDYFYVFWRDYRTYSTDSKISVYCARVTTDGTVIDPSGKMLYKNRVGSAANPAFDGTNFLVVYRDSC